MNFKAESDLVVLLKSSLRSTYQRENVEIFEEISLGYGVADLVVCDLVKPIQKTKYKNVILNRSDVNIYKIIQASEGITCNKLSDTTRSSRRSISDSLRKLLKLKYIKQREDDFFINKVYEFPYKNSFAIEAKLKNWKRALSQAYRYKWFAEFSYVVLDAHYAEPALNNIDLFIKYNVGLSTISVDGNLVRHFSPKRQKPYDPIMQMLLSEKIKHDYAFAK